MVATLPPIDPLNPKPGDTRILDGGGVEIYRLVEGWVTGSRKSVRRDVNNPRRAEDRVAPARASDGAVEISVGDLLRASMQAHLKAKPRTNKEQRPQDWYASLLEAATFRKEALRRDPDQKDPEWSLNHDDFMAFYRDMGAL